MTMPPRPKTATNEARFCDRGGRGGTVPAFGKMTICTNEAVQHKCICARARHVEGKHVRRQLLVSTMKSGKEAYAAHKRRHAGVCIRISLHNKSRLENAEAVRLRRTCVACAKPIHLASNYN